MLTQLRRLGAVYGVEDIRDLETRSGGDFAVTVALAGDTPLRIRGRVAFDGDEMRITYLDTGRRWLNLVAAGNLLHKPLPIHPEQTASLKALWPN